MSATPALPVLVDCAPYHTRLSMIACAQRFTIAGGGTWKKGDPSGSAAMASADLRNHSLCKGCPVGAARAAELGAAAIDAKLTRKVGTVSRRKAPRVVAELARAVAFNPYAAAREKLAHPQAGPTPATTKTTNEGKAMAETRKCEECGDAFEPARSDSRFCSKRCMDRLGYRLRKNGAPKKPRAPRADVSTPAPRADVSTPARPRSPFETFVALNAVVDERRRVAEESIAAAEAAVAEFVTAHPDVVDEARAKVERWAAARATSSSPAPIVRTPPRKRSAGARPRVSGS